MELTQQMTAVQDEVKLLKGEIKTILRELRTAVLSQDNPFSTDANPPAFQPVSRAGPEVSDGQPDAVENEEVAPGPPEALPAVPPAAPPAPPAAAELPAPPSAAPITPPGAVPAGPPASPAAVPEHLPIQAPTPIKSHDEQITAVAEPPPRQWDLLTIASLAAWSEESLASLGPKRYRLVLELATFADLVPQNVRDVLDGMAQETPVEKDENRPMNINECLVVLRQLEAILQGEKVTRLSRRRARRSRNRAR